MTLCHGIREALTSQEEALKLKQMDNNPQNNDKLAKHVYSSDEHQDDYREPDPSQKITVPLSRNNHVVWIK